MAKRDDVFEQTGPLLSEVLTLVYKDELNIIRGWIMSFKTEVAAASDFADLQTRIAALSDLPDKTKDNILTAAQTELGKIIRYNWMD